MSEQRWEMSEASKAIIEASSEALTAARARWQEAQQRHNQRVTEAARRDGVDADIPPEALGRG